MLITPSGWICSTQRPASPAVYLRSIHITRSAPRKYNNISSTSPYFFRRQTLPPRMRPMSLPRYLVLFLVTSLNAFVAEETRLDHESRILLGLRRSSATSTHGCRFGERLPTQNTARSSQKKYVRPLFTPRAHVLGLTIFVTGA